MKKNNHTLLLIILLLIVMALWLLPTILLRDSPPYKPTYISVDDPYACKKIGDEWVSTADFQVDQDIYICGNINLSGPEKQKEVWISIYEGKKSYFEDQIYFDVINVSDKETTIPIRTYLNPGSYEIQITDGRKILAEIMIRVMDD